MQEMHLFDVDSINHIKLDGYRILPFLSLSHMPLFVSFIDKNGPLFHCKKRPETVSSQCPDLSAQGKQYRLYFNPNDLNPKIHAIIICPIS
jgi:hypothetical protein